METKYEIECPKCGDVTGDYDGLGFFHCYICGYCIHPNSTTENGVETCGFCGEVLNKEPVELKCMNYIIVNGNTVPKCGNNYALYHDSPCESCVFTIRKENLKDG